MSDKIVKRTPPVSSSENPFTYYCTRKKERLIAEYMRSKPRSDTPHPLRYAHPIFTVSGRVW
jgi:hypothetical protein